MGFGLDNNRGNHTLLTCLPILIVAGVSLELSLEFLTFAGNTAFFRRRGVGVFFRSWIFLDITFNTQRHQLHRRNECLPFCRLKFPILGKLKLWPWIRHLTVTPTSGAPKRTICSLWKAYSLINWIHFHTLWVKVWVQVQPRLYGQFINNKIRGRGKLQFEKNRNLTFVSKLKHTISKLADFRTKEAVLFEKVALHWTVTM